MSSYPYGQQEAATMVDQYAPMATGEATGVVAQWHPPTKDYSVPLQVDCSIEYELPDCTKPPPGVKVEPLVMIHPVYFRMLESLTRVPFENNMPKSDIPAPELPPTPRVARQSRPQLGPARVRPQSQSVAPRGTRRPLQPTAMMPPPEQVDFRQTARRGRPPGGKQAKRYPNSNPTYHFHAQFVQSMNVQTQYNTQMNLQHGHQTAMQLMQPVLQQIQQPAPQYFYPNNAQEQSMNLGSFVAPMTMAHLSQQVDLFCYQAPQQYAQQIAPQQVAQQLAPQQLVHQQYTQQIVQQRFTQHTVQQHYTQQAAQQEISQQTAYQQHNQQFEQQQLAQQQLEQQQLEQQHLQQQQLQQQQLQQQQLQQQHLQQQQLQQQLFQQQQLQEQQLQQQQLQQQQMQQQQLQQQQLEQAQQQYLAQHQPQVKITQQVEVTQQLTQQPLSQEQQTVHPPNEPEVHVPVAGQAKTPTYAEMVNICGQDFLTFIDELSAGPSDRDRNQLMDDNLSFDAAYPDREFQQMLAKNVATESSVSGTQHNVSHSNNSTDYDIEHLLFKDKTVAKSTAGNERLQLETGEDMQTNQEEDSIDNYCYNDEDMGMAFLMSNALQQNSAQTGERGVMQDGTSNLLSDNQNKASALVKPLVANKQYSYSELTSVDNCDNLSYTEIQGNVTTPPEFVPLMEMHQQQMNVFSM